MANPKLKKGFTRIANEIMEALAYVDGFTTSMNKIVLVVLRKTYGWKKKEDSISISQLQELTHLSRRTVIYTTQQLEVKNILVITRKKVEGTSYNEPNLISFNKDYDSWKSKNCSRQVEKNRSNNYKIYKRDIVQKMKKNNTADSAKVRTNIVQKYVKDSAKALHPQKKQKKVQKKGKKYEYFLNGKQIGELIDAFKPINPMYQDFFSRNVERQAVDLLAQRIGYDKTLSVIQQLPKLTALPFAPKISSPTQLRRELGKMIIFYNQEMSKRSSTKKEDREIIL